MAKTNADIFKAQADEAGIPLRTLEQVKADLADAKKRSKGKNEGMDIALARLMLKAGRLTPDALQYVIAYVDHVWQCEAYGITRTDK